MKWAAIAVVVSLACRDDARTEKPRAEKEVVEVPAPVPPAPIDAAAAPAWRPLPTQLPAVAADVQFLGWTEDGGRFVVQTTRGFDLEELGGRNLLGLIEVRDAATGALVESFRRERAADDDVAADDPLSLAWREAQPQATWKAFRRSTPLAARDPRLAAGDGSWSIAVEAAGEAPHGSAFAVDAGEDAVRTTWAGFDADRVNRPSRRPVGAPIARVVLRRGDELRTLLEFAPPWDYDEVNASRDERDPSVAGELSVYPSPAADRALLIVTHEIHDAHEEHGDLLDARWYVVSLTPEA